MMLTLHSIGSMVNWDRYLSITETYARNYVVDAQHFGYGCGTRHSAVPFLSFSLYYLRRMKVVDL